MANGEWVVSHGLSKIGSDLIGMELLCRRKIPDCLFFYLVVCLSKHISYFFLGWLTQVNPAVRLNLATVPLMFRSYNWSVKLPKMCVVFQHWCYKDISMPLSICLWIIKVPFLIPLLVSGFQWVNGLNYKFSHSNPGYKRFKPQP